ncbi:MAG: nucleotide disphospho-sugar-binding domain-containing protein, partial [Usitatibacter sp.]
GHETAFTFLDLAPLGGEAAGEVEWFQAPVLQGVAQPSAAPVNASEILLNRGYGDPASVVGALRGWLSLFSLYKPDLVVADYAPGALMGARAAGIRSVAIGTGFSSPPIHDPMPALRSWNPPEEAALRVPDSRVLSSVREAFERLDLHNRAPSTAGDMFRAGSTLLCTWPEIDPFGPRDEAEYLGPQDDPRAGAQAAWRTEERPRILAYLKPRDPRFLTLVESIRAIAGEAIIAAPGLSIDDAVKLSSPTLRIRGEALALPTLLATTDLCVCHSGPGIVGRALEAGVPLALVPQQLEQSLVGRRVVSAGAGVMIALNEGVQDFRVWMRDALSQPDLRAAAAASPLRGHKPVSAARRIARELEA